VRKIESKSGQRAQLHISADHKMRQTHPADRRARATMRGKKRALAGSASGTAGCALSHSASALTSLALPLTQILEATVLLRALAHSSALD
jgi:GR25 family glycosyltransferase involved in LPS biosynthesis